MIAGGRSSEAASNLRSETLRTCPNGTHLGHKPTLAEHSTTRMSGGRQTRTENLCLETAWLNKTYALRWPVDFAAQVIFQTRRLLAKIDPPGRGAHPGRRAALLCSISL